MKPEHAHWPLVFLLVFSQASVGLLAAAMVPILDGGVITTPALVASLAFMGVALWARIVSSGASAEGVARFSWVAKKLV